MGFTFRKLYPAQSELIPSCCGVLCECFEVCDPTTVVITRCYCPLTIVTSPCDGDQECGGQICSNGGIWGAWGNLNTAICAPSTVECTCYTINHRICTNWRCEITTSNPECCPIVECYDFPYSQGGYTVGARPNFTTCEVAGAKPYTYKIENLGGLDDFVCSPQRSSGDPVEYESYGVSAIYNTDPAFTKNREMQRFYKSPSSPSGVAWGATSAYTPYCIKIHSTPSQEAGIENRTMVLSGRNVYRYTGYFSGDPYVSSADPFWDNPAPGGSGIKQLEESIQENGQSRTFPLPDRVLQYPLWGQEQNNNFGINFGDCVRPYLYCEDDESTDQRCVGCSCLRSNPYQTIDYLGHYGVDFQPNEDGYTAGYFSFAEFNPECYLDYVYGTVPSDIPVIPSSYQVFGAGAGNSLGFGTVIGDSTFPNGVSGATSHGPRLGVPPCSVWSLVNAVYSRILYAYLNVNSSLGYNTPTESSFRTLNGSQGGFKRFSDAIADMLNDDPSETINGTSKVQYHFAKVKEKLKQDSIEYLVWGPQSDRSPIVTLVTNQLPPYFDLTFPNVFLWDQVAYENAIGKEKWKHLYVVGNGNVVWDSRSIAATGSYQVLGTNFSFNLHDDVKQQNYLSSVLFLNEVNHQQGNITNTSNQARLIIFPGSGGPTTVFSSSNYRKNATAKISLVEMPICAGFTAPDEVGGPYLSEGKDYISVSLCSICNALPNAVCARSFTQSGTDSYSGLGQSILDNTAECSPVTIIDNPYYEAYFCGHIGGLVVEENALTASYQI